MHFDAQAEAYIRGSLEHSQKIKQALEQVEEYFRSFQDSGAVEQELNKAEAYIRGSLEKSRVIEQALEQVKITTVNFNAQRAALKQVAAHLRNLKDRQANKQ